MRAVSLLFLLVTVTSAGARSPRVPCPGGRFLTPDGGHVVADVTAPASETIVLEATAITIDPACARVVYKPHRTRKGTLIRAAWEGCTTAVGPVKLRALQPARDCDVLKGTVRIKGARPARRKLRATRAPYEYDVP